jgi:C4-dicarboxylate transporter, DctM subunit
LIALEGPPLTILPERLFDSSTNFLLMAVPFFIFTGAIMQSGGLGARLIEFSSALVGRFRGGLLYTNVISSAIFADISGSSAADTAAIGSVMLPEMVKRGYDTRFSTALQAASGTLGVLVPPSITALVYAWIADVSVIDMFLATILPAILMALSFCALCYFKALREDYPREKSLGPAAVVSAFGRGVWALAAPVIILGGILTGIVTPTESGVIAVVYTILISFVIYRTMNWDSLRLTAVSAVLGTARVMFILGGSLLLGWVLTYQGIPQSLTSALLGLSQNPLVLLILLNIVLILIHEVLETSATLVLVVPLVLPLLTRLGVSPIHVGIVFLMNSALGIVTPPAGILLYVAAPITGIRVETLFRAIVPFLVLLLIDLSVIVVFPEVSTIVPTLVHHR